jgi:hypothetical protein
MVGEDSEPKKMCSELAGTHFYDQKNKNSDENSGVQKVRNRVNRGIPWNSEQISQPRLSLRLPLVPVNMEATVATNSHLLYQEGDRRKRSMHAALS